MNRVISLLRPALAAGILLVMLFGALPTAAAQEEPASVLVWTGTYGFRHPSITQAQRTFLELDAAHDEFSVEITENPADLNRMKLAATDVLVWVSTTGKPPMTDQQRADIIAWAACGGGTMAFHAAADSNYGWDDYAELLGAQFDSHPYTGDALMTVEDDAHPITEGWAGMDSFEINDEWYRWRGAKRLPGMSLPRGFGDVHVLLSLDETTIPKEIQEGPTPYEDDQPIAWTKTFRGAGRVYYNNMGHSDGTWSVPEFQTSIVNGIDWVNDVPLDADCYGGDPVLPAPPAPPRADPATASQPCTVPEVAERTGGTWETSGPVRALTAEGDELQLPSAGIPGNLAWGAQGYVLDLAGADALAADVTVELDFASPSDDYDLSVTTPWGWYGSDANPGTTTEKLVIANAPHCGILWMYGDNMLAATGPFTGQAPTLRVSVEPVDGARGIAPACPPDEVPPAKYEDVADDSVHGAAIDCVTWWGIASGTSEQRYGPGGNVSREQLASFVARMVEQSGVELEAGEDHFDDDNGSVHEEAINKLASAGVISGRGPKAFAPRASVTRGAMATILVKGYELVVKQELRSGNDYFDDDHGTTHEPSINKLAEARIATGVAAAAFAPGSNVRRDEMASFLARTLARLVDDGATQPPSDA